MIDILTVGQPVRVYFAFNPSTRATGPARPDAFMALQDVRAGVVGDDACILTLNISIGVPFPCVIHIEPLAMKDAT